MIRKRTQAGSQEEKRTVKRQSIRLAAKHQSTNPPSPTGSSQQASIISSLLPTSGDGPNLPEEGTEQALIARKSGLCRRCASLDVDNFFSPREDEKAPRRIVELGTLEDSFDLSSCSLCQLFHAVSWEYGGSKWTSYALYSIRPLPPFSNGCGSVLSVVRHVLDLPHQFSFDAQAEYGLIATVSTPDARGHPGSLQARRIHADSVDFSVLRDWFNWCLTSHTGFCDHSGSTISLPGLKLIDCKQRRVIDAPVNAKYLALSYVWGSSKYSDAHVLDHGRLPMTLPRTIEDALVVTKELCLRYIWIDRYCIDQADDLDLYHQTRHMDLIYRNAQITIVDATGTHPYSGLPGVSINSRDHQPHAWAGGYHLVSTLANPQILIRKSEWMSRAWTYQECFFSSRRLVFTMQQVYFECRFGSAYETILHPEERTRHHLFSNPARREVEPWKIIDHLQEYCGRKLSFDGDAIRAFAGVLHEFRVRDFPVYHHFGVPIMPQSYRLYEGGPAGPLMSSVSESFIAGLCWQNSRPGRRRPEFPSWNWAGWTVPIDADLRECFEGLRIKNEDRLRLWVETSEGKLLDVDHDGVLDMIHNEPQSFSNFISIEAWTVSLDMYYSPEAVRYRVSYAKLGRSWSHYSALFTGLGASILILALPLTDDTDKPKSRFSPTSGKFLGVILGGCDDPIAYRSLFATFCLVVQDRGDHFERIGCMLLSSDHTREASELGHNVQFLREHKERLANTLFLQSKQRRCLRIG